MMRSLEQRARARLGEVVQGFELDAVESTDVLSALFTARSSERVTSICILHERWAALPGFRAGFARAAWLSQTLDHSSIPRVLNSGLTEDGMPYIAYELVGGEALASYLERRVGTVPPAEALRIAGALGDGLATIADNHSVHGAVQPGAIALTELGDVRLLHTGWTRLREQAAAHLGHSTLPGLAGYLSPDQARGEAPTPADDLWSLGAILFELLGGVSVRPGESDAERLEGARQADVPSLAAQFPHAPTEMVDLLDRALTRSRDDRLTAAEFASRCRHLAQSSAVSRLRCLAPREEVAEFGRRSSHASRSGVSAVGVPPARATGTTTFRPSRELSNAGTYSSYGQLRIDTLQPKKS